MSTPPRVLFVCTGNAGRSQIAQAMLRSRLGDAVEVESAGVRPWEALHPMAVRVMQRRGVAMEGQRPKSALSVSGRAFDVVVTLGDPALRELPHDLTSPPLWSHWDIADPADADGTAQSEAVFERTADAIARRLDALQPTLDAMGRRRGRGGRVGVGTGLWPRQRFDVRTHLAQIVSTGFDAIELCYYQGRHHFDPDDQAAVRELKQACDDMGVRIWSVHSLDTGSLGSPDAAERQRQIDELRRALALSDALGAKIVVSHALVLGRWADDAQEADRLLRDSLERLLPETLASTASIAFENGYTGKPGRAGADIIARLKPFPRAAYGFVLDTGHSNIEGDLNRIADAVEQRLISTHLNDNDGQRDIHLVPTEGTADWPRVQAILRDAAYSGCVMHEVMAVDDDPVSVLQRTMRHHRRLWPQVVPG